jgi:uncharacterized damage-inducible protein DinB
MLNHPLIAEIKHEGAQTRKLLERVPFENPEWQPHERSMSLGRLATHIAEIPGWTSRILAADEFDVAPLISLKPSVAAGVDALLQTHDERIHKALADLQAASDEDLTKKWTFRRGEHVVFSMPRVSAIRTMAMNHLLHHRGQLSVYLRLLGVPIPGMYGPSADEKM